MKTKYLFISCLSAAMMLFASCGSDDDSNGDGGNGGGGSSDVPAMSASEAKQSLQNTADDLLSKIKVSEFNNFKHIFDAVDGWDVESDRKTQVIQDWFDAAEEACLVSAKNGKETYLWKAANFVGEFSLGNSGVWTQTKKGGDQLVFRFNDDNNSPCVLTVSASKDGAEIHHNVFDEEDWYEYYENGYWHYGSETVQENRFILPKKTVVTLTQNGSEVVKATVNANVTTGHEVDLSKDAVDVTSEVVVNDYRVVVSKASYKQGKTAEAKATIYKGNDVLVTVEGDAAGNVTSTGDGSTVGKTSITVDVLGKAKFVTVIDDVNLLMENLDNADDAYDDKTRVERYLSNANKLLHSDLYLKGSSNSSASLSYKAVNDYGYWDYEQVMKFADGSEYSIDSYFNENSFKSVVDTVNDIIRDFCEMFGIDDDDDSDDDWDYVRPADGK